MEAKIIGADTMSILFGVHGKGRSNLFFFPFVSFVSSDREYEREREKERKQYIGK